MRIVWSPLALDRASEIVDYIALDNPHAATKWLDTLFEKIETLKFNPEIGRMVPEIDNEQFREIIFGNYRIIYRFANKDIFVLTIRHGKQILSADEII